MVYLGKFLGSAAARIENKSSIKNADFTQSLLDPFGLHNTYPMKVFAKLYHQQENMPKMHE